VYKGHETWSFGGDRSQWNILGQTAASRWRIPTFRILWVTPETPENLHIYSGAGTSL